MSHSWDFLPFYVIFTTTLIIILCVYAVCMDGRGWGGGDSLGYQPLRKREEGSGNIPIQLLCKWNVVNVIFTTLWTATHVASNQNHRARANDHSTMYWRDSKPIAHSASKYCTWRSRARPHCDLIGHVHIPDMSTTRV